MNEDGGQGLLILAFVVIAFINWVSTTLKERAERRDAAKRRARNLQESPPPAPAQETWTEPEPTTVSREAKDPSQQLRDFFDSLAGNKPKPVEQPPPHREPAPAQIPPPRAEREAERWKAPEVRRTTLSAEERRALERLKSGNAGRERSRSGASTSRQSLIEKLRSASGAREAVILAEILGKPKGLADHQPQS